MIETILRNRAMIRGGPFSAEAIIEGGRVAAGVSRVRSVSPLLLPRHLHVAGQCHLQPLHRHHVRCPFTRRTDGGRLPVPLLCSRLG